MIRQLRLQHFLILLPVSLTMHLSIHFLLADDQSDTQKISMESSVRNFYVEKLKNELSSQINKKGELPLHKLTVIHENHASQLEASGHTRAFLDEVFKEWFYDKFGIEYKKDTITKRSKNSYIIKLKNKTLKDSNIVEKKDRIQIFIDDKKTKDKKELNQTHSIVIPKSKKTNYEITKRSATNYEIKSSFR